MLMDTTSDSDPAKVCEACSEPITGGQPEAGPLCGCHLHASCYAELMSVCPCGGGDASGYMCLAVENALDKKKVCRIATTSVVKMKSSHMMRTTEYIVADSNSNNKSFRLLLVYPSVFDHGDNDVTLPLDGGLIDAVTVPLKNIYKHQTYECQSTEAKRGHFRICLNWVNEVDLTIFSVEWYPACEFGIVKGLVDNLNYIHSKWSKIAASVTHDDEDIGVYEKRLQYLGELTSDGTLTTPAEVQLLVDIVAPNRQNVVFQVFAQCVYTYQEMKRQNQLCEDDLRILSRLEDCGTMSREKMASLLLRIHKLLEQQAKMVHYCLDLIHDHKDAVIDLEKLVEAAVLYHNPPRENPDLYKKVPAPSLMAKSTPTKRRHLLMNLWVDSKTPGDHMVGHKRPRDEDCNEVVGPKKKHKQKGWVWTFD